MILCIHVVSVATSPFSFLILLIWSLSLLFFLMSLAKGLPILSIFSDNQLSFIDLFYILVSISFISALVIFISFFPLTLGFVLLFLVSLGVRLGYLRFFLVS